MKKLVARRPALFARLMSLWPPFFWAGIRVDFIAPDWREVHTSLTLRFFNSNYVGTHFGGSLFAMADPFYMIMLANLLGRDYRVWDQAAEITFLKPGKGKVEAVFRVTDQDLAEIRAACSTGEKYLRDFTVDITDQAAEKVATVRKVVYVRLKRDAGLAGR
jgi:acyl-coenzyme A thioesterase PaaI-like protein